MHKLKIAIADLRAYLGRDTQGLGLLAQIERVGNDVRKQAATEKDRGDSAVRERASAIAALKESEREIEQLRSQLRREQDVSSQLERDVSSRKQRVTELERQLRQTMGDEPDKCSVERSVDAALSAIESLRRWRRVCPKQTGMLTAKQYAVNRHFPIHDLTTLIPKMSAADMMGLGRFVAVLAMMNLPCIIESTWLVKDHCDMDKDERFRRFFRWFQKNVDCGQFEKSSVEKAITGSFKGPVHMCGGGEFYV